ncbi:MAG: tetratricopeptide repeat protein [Acidobacteriia bacterium]|nr:tetratricopeptide repeat protein [Terriglobia bacterium]
MRNKPDTRHGGIGGLARTLARPSVPTARWFVMPTALLAILLSASLGHAQTRFQVTHYAIDAELYPATHILTAKARVDFLAKTDLTTLAFDLHSSLRVDKVLDADGGELRFRRDGLNLQVDFLNPVQAGKTSSVTVSYGGPLASADGSPVEGLKLAYVGDEGSYLLYPGRWFPVSNYGVDRFAATMRITVPSGLTVIASGKELAPQQQTGKTTYAFDFDQPSFPGTVLAGKYVVQPGTAVGANIALYLKPGHEQFAASYGEAAARILTFYSDEFGALPSGRLAIAEIEDGTVNGYTAPGVVALASRGFSNPVNARLLAYAIANLWWHCLVSPASADDAFLDAGLATYSAAMYIESSAGENEFEDRMHEIEIGALTHEEVAPIAQAGRLHEFTPEYEAIVFNKGAMVFHMLRWVLGEDAYLKTLQAMARDYAWKSISTDEFEKLAEKTSNQELTYFFAQWVSSTGVPQFKRTWAVYRTAKGYQVVGKIQQDLDIFRMPVEIRVFAEGRKPVNERVEMVGTTADFTVNTLTRPLRVLVDPASRILKYDDSIKTAVEMAKGDQMAQQQAYLEALKQYQKVLELNKNNSLAHFRIGEIHFKLRNYNAAAEEMRAALNGDLQPKWVEVWAHLTLGKIFDATGQRDRALNEYQRALQTNDNTQGALDEANRYTQKPYTEESRQIG